MGAPPSWLAHHSATSPSHNSCAVSDCAVIAQWLQSVEQQHVPPSVVRTPPVMRCLAVVNVTLDTEGTTAVKVCKLNSLWLYYVDIYLHSVLFWEVWLELQ